MDQCGIGKGSWNACNKDGLCSSHYHLPYQIPPLVALVFLFIILLAVSTFAFPSPHLAPSAFFHACPYLHLSTPSRLFPYLISTAYHASPNLHVPISHWLISPPLYTSYCPPTLSIRIQDFTPECWQLLPPLSHHHQCYLFHWVPLAYFLLLKKLFTSIGIW